MVKQKTAALGHAIDHAPSCAGSLSALGPGERVKGLGRVVASGARPG
jgi:hypothetical protein